MLDYFFFNELENATIEDFYQSCKKKNKYNEQKLRILDESTN